MFSRQTDARRAWNTIIIHVRVPAAAAAGLEQGARVRPTDFRDRARARSRFAIVFFSFYS